MDPIHRHQHNSIELPGWMQTNPAIDGCLPSGSNHTRFLRRSILEIRRTMADLMMAERYAAVAGGLLQKLDPRLKLSCAILLLLTIGITRNSLLLAGIWLLTLGLIWSSKLPLVKMQIRIWASIPLITFIISVPAMLNVFMSGIPLVTFYHSLYPVYWAGILMPDTIFISRQGLTAGIYLFTRVGLSLSVGMLLTVTTPAAALFKSMQEFKFPAMLVTIAEMSYRYLGLLLNLSVEMFEARSMRTVGNISASSRRGQIGTSMASLFARSMSVADEVYLAMAARGYTGNPVMMKRS